MMTKKQYARKRRRIKRDKKRLMKLVRQFHAGDRVRNIDGEEGIVRAVENPCTRERLYKVEWESFKGIPIFPTEVKKHDADFIDSIGIWKKLWDWSDDTMDTVTGYDN